ncbi:hypothetical protein AVEN_218955-1 [Araneus ventricosus]|uniref:Uncharacterized protein n=1 Tax=Araneus ventricosus TaxID=182803 RepID=A0A4Y2Q1Z0_ARAVE|nr:hypothetical protein AVEN_218955-1 [Araneus ventricosus]
MPSCVRGATLAQKKLYDHKMEEGGSSLEKSRTGARVWGGQYQGYEALGIEVIGISVGPQALNSSYDSDETKNYTYPRAPEFLKMAIESLCERPIKIEGLQTDMIRARSQNVVERSDGE